MQTNSTQGKDKIKYRQRFRDQTDIKTSLNTDTGKTNNLIKQPKRCDKFKCRHKEETTS